MAVKHCLLYTVYTEMKTNRKMRQTLYVRHQLGKGGEGESERMDRCGCNAELLSYLFMIESIFSQ